MKKTLILLAAAMALCACQFNLGNLGGFSFNGGKTIKCDGEVMEKSFDLTGFDAITVKGNANVVFAQAESHQVSVKANEEVFEYLEFRLEDGNLAISTKDGVVISAKTYKVFICSPVLKDVKITGAADLDVVDGYVSTEPVNVEVDGAGDMTFVDVSVPSMSITINGAADLDIENVKVPDLSVTVNGAGDVDIANLESDSVSLTVRGAGDVQVSGTTRAADFHVAGAGAIDARALKCENVTTAKHGAASIKL